MLDDLKMKMRSRASSGASQQADGLSFLDMISRSHLHPAQVHIPALESVRMLDDNALAAGSAGISLQYGACPRRIDGISRLSGDVHA